jgi:hypothetical protein
LTSPNYTQEANDDINIKTSRF